MPMVINVLLVYGFYEHVQDWKWTCRCSCVDRVHDRYDVSFCFY